MSEASEKRSRVSEHRITRSLHNGMTARFWIESDPEWGGESRADAQKKISEKYESLGEAFLASRATAEEWAFLFLEAVPSANSIEICDAHGNGTAVHRDWP